MGNEINNKRIELDTNILISAMLKSNSEIAQMGCIFIPF